MSHFTCVARSCASGSCRPASGNVFSNVFSDEMTVRSNYFDEFSPIALATVMGCLAASALLAAQPSVTYTASGRSAVPPFSTQQCSSCRVNLSASLLSPTEPSPKTHGPQWALLIPLKMTATVQSSCPIAHPPRYIQQQHQHPVGNRQPPSGSTPAGLSHKHTRHRGDGSRKHCHAKGVSDQQSLILPFTAPVTLTPADATMTYSDATATATLGINGTLTATVPGNPPVWVCNCLGTARKPSPHTRMGRNGDRIGAGAVDLGAPSDVVALRLFRFGCARVRRGC